MSSNLKSLSLQGQRIVVSRSAVKADYQRSSCLERHIVEGDNPVCGVENRPRSAFYESGCLGMQPKMGGKLLLKLNIGTRPIANKYREGKMKSTLKRKLIVRETVKREAHGISNALSKFRQAAVSTLRRVDPNGQSALVPGAVIRRIFRQRASTAVGTGREASRRGGQPSGWCYKSRWRSRVRQRSFMRYALPFHEGGWSLAVPVACRIGRTACSALELLVTASTVRSAHDSCPSCWRSYDFMRPVLKHGPRSLTCVRVFG